MTDKLTDERKLDIVLDAAEAAVLGASDDELNQMGDANAVRGVVSGMLRVYGFEADGSPRAAKWRRSRDGRRLIGTSTRPRLAPPQELLRATFDSGKRGEDSGDDDDDRQL